MPLHIVIGALYGDEGKGRVVQALAKGHAVVARATGGANASHTVFHKGKEITLRQVPCGVFSKALCTTGDGMVLDPLQLVDELAMLNAHGVDTSRVRISERAAVVTPLHRLADRARGAYTLSDDAQVIGTTQQGVGPALVDKAMRTALRFDDLHDAQALKRSMLATIDRFPELKQHKREVPAMVRRLVKAHQLLRGSVMDTRDLVYRALRLGQDVLVEGSQGTLLDVDHGAYPFVTATHPTTGGVLASLGVGPQEVERVIGVARTFMTRQAQGPFFTEVTGPSEQAFRHITQEHVLRVGWLDAVALRGAARLNGFTELVLTNVDRLMGFPAVALATRYLDPSGAAHRLWLRPEQEPAGVRYVQVKPDLSATTGHVGPIRTRAARVWEPFISRVAQEVGLPIRHVSASAAGPLVVRAL